MNDQIEGADLDAISRPAAPAQAASQLQSEVIKSAQEKIDGFTRAAIDRYQKVEQATRQRVTDRPGTSMALVAAAGILLGIAIGKKRSSRASRRIPPM